MVRARLHGEVLRMESTQEETNIRTATLYPTAVNTELL